MNESAENCVIVQTTALQEGRLPKEKLVGLVDERIRGRYGDESELPEEAHAFLNDFIEN